jgi:hypothetical protein
MSTAEKQFVRDGINLRTLAQCLRSVPFLVIFSLLTMMVTGKVRLFIRIGPSVVLLGYLAVRIVVALGVVRLMFVLKTNPLALVICFLAALIPFADLLLLIWESRRGFKVLHKHGLGIRDFGLSDHAVVDILAHPTCQRCGYNLTGNTIGKCPECGTDVAWRRTD